MMDLDEVGGESHSSPRKDSSACGSRQKGFGASSMLEFCWKSDEVQPA